MHETWSRIQKSFSFTCVYTYIYIYIYIYIYKQKSSQVVTVAYWKKPMCQTNALADMFYKDSCS